MRRARPTDPATARQRIPHRHRGAARKRAALSFCILLLCATAAAAAGGSDAFRAGVEASRAGDYREAVQHFEAARRAGLDTPALHFNLGVALYRMGAIERARSSFLRAYRKPELAAPAAYNLGRIARETGETTAALRWFTRTVELARTDAVRVRAQRTLTALERAPAPDSLVFASAGMGYDSNVELAPDESAALSREADLFASAQAFAVRRVGGGVYLFGTAYTEQYRNEHDSDLVTVAAGGGWRGSGERRPHVRLGVRHERLGGDTFENALLARADIEGGPGPGSARLGIEAERHAGGPAFDYLDGNAGRAFISWQPGLGEGLWTLDAEIQRVNRRDADEGDDFFSFSYWAAALEMGHKRRLGPDAALLLSAGWTGYRYDDPEVRGGLERDRRREHRIEIGAAYEQQIGNGWRSTTRLERDYRESTVETYDYSRLRFMQGFEYTF